MATTKTHKHPPWVRAKAPLLQGALFPWQMLWGDWGRSVRKGVRTEASPPSLCISTAPNSHGLVSLNKFQVVITALLLGLLEK